MNPQEQISKASEYASAFEAFITAHPLVVCIALAWVVSWVTTVTARPFLKVLLPDHLERPSIRLFDVALATFAAFKMWPGDHAIWWALGIGGSSPIAYLALSEALCWKWPSLRNRLSLRELGPDEPTGDELNPPPGSRQ